MFLIVNRATSQNDQLSIDCTIYKDGIPSLENKFVVKITDDINQEFDFDSKVGFTCELNYGHIYRIIFYSYGCQPKLITIDTRIEPTKERYKYTFAVDLKTSENKELLEAGGVLYNKDSINFEYCK